MSKENRTIYYKFEDHDDEYKNANIKAIKKAVLKEQIFCCNMTKDIALYGEKLLFRMLDDYNNIYRDDIVIMLHRDVLELIDAISALFEKTSYSSIKILLRTLFERMLIVTYILQPEDSIEQEKRACEYMLINLQERRNFLKELEDYKQAKKVEKQINSLENYEHYKNNISSSKFKLYQENNYSINFRNLANEVKCLELYYKYYSTMSNQLHGKNIIDYVTYSKDTSFLLQLRYPFNSIDILEQCCTIVLRIFNLFESRLFENYQSYLKWEKTLIDKVNVMKEQCAIAFHPKEFKRMKNIDMEKYIEIK